MSKRYLVTWVIDIEESADNPTEAAVQALIIQRDPESTATHFTVTDKDTGETVEVDLDRVEVPFL